MCHWVSYYDNGERGLQLARGELGVANHNLYQYQLDLAMERREHGEQAAIGGNLVGIYLEWVSM